ncbi:LINE-1 reverse transcriptase-like protein [Formica fusca]
MELLGGTKERRIMEEDRREEEDIGKNGELEEITKEELMKQLKRLKREKAPGENGIENEAWGLMPKEIGEVFLKLLNKIWKERRIPEEWNKGLISPIYKKGEKRDVRNYRGVTLMDTAYKIYTNIWNEKLKQEVETKLEEGQFGFRAGRRTIDAIYLLNYTINKEMSKKRGQIFAMFIDLKAAFDKVDRMKMGEMMKKAGIGEHLRRRIMETYKETKNKVKVGNRRTEEFWTESGVRQGCPMSPTLFNMYIMDLEAEMRKEQTGGIVVGKENM